MEQKLQILVALAILLGLFLWAEFATNISGGRKILNEWAERNGYKISRLKQKPFGCAVYSPTRPGDVVFELELAAKTGRVYRAWALCSNGKAEVHIP